MKTIVALSALILAVCVVNSHCKSSRNTNTNINTNTNSNGDFLSSYLNSMLNQERKGKSGKAVVASRVVPDITAQQEDQQDADESLTDEDSFDESAPAFAPQQEEESQDDFLTAVPVSQLKFFQTLAAKAQKLPSQ